MVFSGSSLASSNFPVSLSLLDPFFGPDVRFGGYVHPRVSDLDDTESRKHFPVSLNAF